jgi:hypothetical protein
VTDDTHEWLQDELAEPEAHERASHAERVLQRRATLLDWVQIILIVAVVAGAGFYGVTSSRNQHATNQRADAAKVRSDRTAAAVIDALTASVAAQDATARIVTDFAELVAARTPDEKQAAFDHLAQDRAAVEASRTASQDALNKAQSAKASP